MKYYINFSRYKNGDKLILIQFNFAISHKKNLLLNKKFNGE